MKGISIVICVYNEEYSLLEALRSIKKNQCYATIEIIIINDCSKNPITNRILFWLKKLTKIIISSTYKNMGLSGARNMGINMATTPFIIPLDADDILPDNSVDLILKTFKEHKDIDFIYGDYLKIQKEKRQEIRVSNATISTKTSLDVEKLLNNWTLLGASPFKKTTWKKVNGYSLKYSNTVQDVDFWLKVIKDGMTGYYVDKVLYIWNLSEQGMNSTYNKKDYYYMLEDHLDLYIKYYKENILVNDISSGFYSNHQFKNTVLFNLKHFSNIKLINNLKILWIPILILKKYLKNIKQ